MAIIHDKYVIELKEVIKGYGNDPQVKDPLKFPCDYKFYEIDGVAICENSFKKMKRLEDVAIPKADYEARLKENNELINDLEELRTMINKFAESYETRLKADFAAMLDEIDLELAEQQADFIGADDYDESYGVQVSRDVIREKINAIKDNSHE